MFKLTTFIAILSLSSALHSTEGLFHSMQNFNAAIDERIIGGNEARKNSYPFMVRITGVRNDGSRYLCGGSLIHEKYVLTAGHCVNSSRAPVRSIQLDFGDHHLGKEDETQTKMDISLDFIQVHPEFRELPLKNDIALIRLPSKAPISNHVQPICVASADTTSKFREGVAMGWGFTANKQDNGKVSDVLKEVNLPIMPVLKCKAFRTFNPKTMMCVGNTEGIQAAICQGDSGGPFVVNDKQLALVGISSFVSSKGCVTVGYGLVFVRVSSYIPWLQNLIGSDLCII